MIPEQPATLAVAPDVALESRLAVPPGAPAGVVICHPHPLYGGDMDNPVVVRVQQVCADLGLATRGSTSAAWADRAGLPAAAAPGRARRGPRPTRPPRP